jgi:hypothetical protein
LPERPARPLGRAERDPGSIHDIRPERAFVVMAALLPLQTKHLAVAVRTVLYHTQVRVRVSVCKIPEMKWGFLKLRKREGQTTGEA